MTDLGERTRRLTDSGVDRTSRLISSAEELYKQAREYATPLFDGVGEGVPEFRRSAEKYFYYALVKCLMGVFLVGKAVYKQNEARLRKDEEIIRLLRGYKTQFDAFMVYIKSKQDDGK